MINLKKMSSVIWPLILILLFAACTDSNDKETISDGVSEIESENKQDVAEEKGIETLEPVLTLDKALDLFHTTFETETVEFESIEFKKNESGSYLYFIEGWDDQHNYQLWIDVGTAEIIEQKKKTGTGITRGLDLDAAIIPKDAMDAALEESESEAVESWLLEIDQKNRMIYKINFLSGRNQTIDALSGEVL